MESHVKYLQGKYLKLNITYESLIQLGKKYLTYYEWLRQLGLKKYLPYYDLFTKRTRIFS